MNVEIEQPKDIEPELKVKEINEEQKEFVLIDTNTACASCDKKF